MTRLWKVFGIVASLLLRCSTILKLLLGHTKLGRFLGQGGLGLEQTLSGDYPLGVEAPLLLWGPYLWADGEVPNSLGTRWCACDFENCNDAHPSASGEQKVADLFGGVVEELK